MQTASKLSTAYRSKPFLNSLNIVKWTSSLPSYCCSLNSLHLSKFTANTQIPLSTLFPHQRFTTRTMAATTEQGPSSTITTTIDPKVAKLRDILQTADNGNPVHAFIIPSEDPHMSEYPPECDARRAFISNFDGSAGTAVVTTDKAALWTDGRYFLQAESQLGPDWTLMKAGTPGVPEIHEWLTTVLPPNASVAIDPTLHTIDAAEKLAKHLTNHGMRLLSLPTNPVDLVWGAERPPAPSASVRIHDIAWAGKSIAEKLQELRAEMDSMQVDVLPVTMLDEVAWLFNIRGSDVPYNPVSISYAIVTMDSASLFIDGAKLSGQAQSYLKEAGVTVKAYEKAFAEIEGHARDGKAILMDPGKVSYAMKTVAVNSHSAVAAAAAATNDSGKEQQQQRKRQRSSSSTSDPLTTLNTPRKNVIKQQTSPLGVFKAIKNEAELSGMREAHLRDAVALIKFFCWLDKTVVEEGKVLTECEIDEHLCALRAAQPGFIEPSFPTIAGAGPNGAIIHYRPLPESCRSVDANTLLLLDSGGQYDCGTTDITRTVHMGTPTGHQQACFTAVLQGHIQLDRAVFPEGTPGCALDVLARTPLWRMGLNYRHGTGHGVGAALNVHEGPQSISSRFWNTQPLLPAMVCSNEPGYYEDGAFGIRIENLFIVVEAPTEYRFAGQSYYTCERLTLVPIQKKMIAKELLSEEEVEWLDSYHADVLKAVAPRLEAEGAEEELAWLKEATSPLRS